MLAKLAVGTLTALILITSSPINAQQTAPGITPSSLAKLTTVDPRFQSYNIEMLEVTGGRFWKPYTAASTPSQPSAESSSTPAGMSPDLYAYRPPKDLSNPRLRKLAAALGPAYVRVSGTWANSTYLPAEGESISKPPAVFNGILTRAQWKGVIDFARVANADLVTSFSTSVGTRDANGLWTTTQAQRLVDLTNSLGGHIAAAEYMNEPTFAMIGGAPKGYDAAQYGRDLRVFTAFMRQHAPKTLIAGPGSVGESANSAGDLGGNMPGFLATPKLLAVMKPDEIDVFSYHSYSGVSQRCASAGMAAPHSSEETALSEEWLARTDAILNFYRQLRDQFSPGKPLWITETGETACGGDPWASTFLDSFRYLDQLGRLAKGGVKVHMHNTLAASDYGLLDENTYAPRPNYWAALLWHHLMGTTVLDAEVPLQQGLHVYAHCLVNRPGGVALLIIQNDREAAHSLDLPTGGERYTLSAPRLDGQDVMLNGTHLSLGAQDQLPELKPIAERGGVEHFAPTTITFIAFPNAHNTACQ
ncbi:MAG TPA: hypothetical protein VFA99_04530 [Acidobacteriaceae bacterium]|nr:hypothetical protein [Acidobacteriaceae bacterium]